MWAGGQALALGLVDQVAVDVALVVFGRGERYFGAVDSRQLLENPRVLIQRRRVLHLRYSRAALLGTLAGPRASWSANPPLSGRCATVITNGLLRLRARRCLHAEQGKVPGGHQ